MQLIVGLGNPGPRYVQSRHNVGFMVAERLVNQALQWRTGFQGVYVQLATAERDLVVLKPLTFMNHSGDAVRAATEFYGVRAQQVVVVHDELDLPFGQLRLKQGGGEGGHNGLRSVSSALGSSDYVRLRIGIGRPPDDFEGRVSDFVLKAFASAEAVALTGHLDRAVAGLHQLLSGGIDAAMNQINRKPI